MADPVYTSGFVVSGTTALIQPSKITTGVTDERVVATINADAVAASANIPNAAAVSSFVDTKIGESTSGISGRLTTVEGYFTNGSAKSAEKATSASTAANAAKAADSDKLGGQVPGYYATSANLKTATDNISALSSFFNDGGVAKHAASADNAGSAAKAASATAADKLKTARNITASGDVTWSVSFDGSQDKTGAATINNIPSAVAWSAVSAEVNTKLSSVYKVKGTATVAEIKALTSKEIGDVYNVSDSGEIATGVNVKAGDNVVWTGTEWDKLAATVDLSPYQTTAGMTAYSPTGHKHTLADITGTDKTNLVGSATSGAAASAWIATNAGSLLSAVNTDTAAYVSGNGTTGSKIGLTSTAKNAVDAVVSAITASGDMAAAGNTAKLAKVGAITGYIAGQGYRQNAFDKVIVVPSAGVNPLVTDASGSQSVAFIGGTNVTLATSQDASGKPAITINKTSDYYDANDHMIHLF